MGHQRSNEGEKGALRSPRLWAPVPCISPALPPPPKQHTVQKREPWDDMERSGAGVTLPGVTLNTLTHPPSLSSLFSGGWQLCNPTPGETGVWSGVKSKVKHSVSYCVIFAC